MVTIKARLKEDEKQLIIDYAKMKNISVSDLIRDAVIERIEDEIDLEIYYCAMEEHSNKDGSISHDEMMKELGL